MKMAHISSSTQASEGFESLGAPVDAATVAGYGR